MDADGPGRLRAVAAPLIDRVIKVPTVLGKLIHLGPFDAQQFRVGVRAHDSFFPRIKFFVHEVLKSGQLLKIIIGFLHQRLRIQEDLFRGSSD